MLSLITLLDALLTISSPRVGSQLLRMQIITSILISLHLNNTRLKIVISCQDNLEAYNQQKHLQALSRSIATKMADDKHKTDG